MNSFGNRSTVEKKGSKRLSKRLLSDEGVPLRVIKVVDRGRIGARGSLLGNDSSVCGVNETVGKKKPRL